MSRSPMTEDELANLSDEELMNMSVPPVMEASADAPKPDETGEEPGGVDEEADDADDTAADAEDAEADGEGGGTGSEDDAEDDEPGGEDDASDDDDVPDSPAHNPLGDADEDADKPVEPAKAPKKKKAEAPKDEKKGEETPADPSGSDSVDYKAAYEKIMGGFKANGKEIKLQNVDEAVQLMQMGANYTKKLQALQPNLKLLKMLENNGLLSEDKLSFLIDIDKKSPSAIQKLMKDSGIDPLDIDTQSEPDYKPGSYQVSDTEMNFNSTLEEVASDPVGQKLVVEINKSWDDQSKEAIWEDPNVLRVLTTQKQQGIYDVVASEVERRRILGHLQNVPFLQAYQAVGQELKEKGALTPKGQAPQPTPAGQPEQRQASQPVETRRKKPKAPSNNDRAKAASPTRSSPKKAAPDFNPLAMSDEDFEKNAELARRL